MIFNIARSKQVLFFVSPLRLMVMQPRRRSKRVWEQKMPAISPQRMQDRYDAILDAAKGAFADKGFEGTSIADIARTARISDGLVYLYFRNKRELLYEV